MTEEQKSERNIADELGKLGQQVADAIKAAWESEDRKKLQTEIVEGFQKFGHEVSQTVEKASESETAKDLRVKAEKVVDDIRESDVVEEIRKGILTGLDTLNRELGKLLNKLESQPASDQPAEPAPEAVTSVPDADLPGEPPPTNA